MFYGDFPWIPFHWFITLQNKKPLFCVFLSFRDLTDIKRTWNFSGAIIFARDTIWEEEVLEGPHEAQTRPGGTGPTLDRATHACFLLERRLPSVLISDRRVWPKTDYIYDPRGVLAMEGGGNRETMKQSQNQRRLERETLPESSPIASPPSPTSSTPPPWWRGSSPPLDYGFVAVAWSTSLLYYVD